MATVFLSLYQMHGLW